MLTGSVVLLHVVMLNVLSPLPPQSSLLFLSRVTSDSLLFILMLLLTSDCSGDLVTLPTPLIRCLCVDFVRITNCFYDYDYFPCFINMSVTILTDGSSSLNKMTGDAPVPTHIFYRDKKPMTINNQNLLTTSVHHHCLISTACKN